MQTDKKQPANKVAMSRALGAAFLSHQVEQLEKSVGRESRGATSSNWRDRNAQSTRGGKRGGAPHPHPPGGRKKERKDGERGDAREVGRTREHVEVIRQTDSEKDADTVVVDASVLVHALGQVKKWCRDGREEEIVIPLEALNTLDLLKKGSTPLAQRARAASRILEAQVGTNPRIRVQRDDAFVLWDNVPFNTTSPDFPPLSDTKAAPQKSGNIPMGLAPPPEWLRRTICCGSWEVASAIEGSSSPGDHTLAVQPVKPSVPPVSRPSTPTSSVDIPHSVAQPKVGPSSERVTGSHTPKKVVLAVLAHPVPAPSGPTPSSLDANTFHPGRYERADGSLVRVWAQRAGIEVLDVDPSSVPPASPLPAHQGHASPEKRRSHAHGGSDRRELREGKDGLPERERERKPSLVEKPIAMAIVNDQPVKVLRVLARGEKLDP